MGKAPTGDHNAARSPRRAVVFGVARAATILLQFDANNSLSIRWQKVSFATAEVGETDQFVTVAVECTPIYDATNGIITAVAKYNVDGICQ